MTKEFDKERELVRKMMERGKALEGKPYSQKAIAGQLGISDGYLSSFMGDKEAQREYFSGIATNIRKHWNTVVRRAMLKTEKSYHLLRTYNVGAIEMICDKGSG